MRLGEGRSRPGLRVLRVLTRCSLSPSPPLLPLYSVWWCPSVLDLVACGTVVRQTTHRQRGPFCALCIQLGNGRYA
eukprot:791189-Prymnesium_polylepis.1